uniref:inositol 1,4,5-trisphosphate receptor-interacting protein n=1 Tax=Pristiophorus japonicus TaxID=55135 RepID=UPI00398EB9D9
MPVGIFAVCLLVAAAVIDRPFTLQPAGRSAEREREADTVSRMKEREERLRAQMLRLEKEFAESLPAGAGPGSGGGPAGEEEEERGWSLWSALIIAALLLLEIWRQDAEPRAPQELASEDEDWDALGDSAWCAALPDHQTLGRLYERCIRVPGNELSRTQELVEGCADDLLEALRSVCDRDLDMEVEECIGVGSLYENWRVERPLVCDLIVPFTPPEPYRFRAQLLRAGPAVCPGEQGYATIRVLHPAGDSASCLCGKTQLGEDMLCLVHDPQIPGGEPGGPRPELLWASSAPYLAKAQVMRWFQVALTKAWAEISHKYDFELTFRDLDRPGALRIRLRSGKAVLFNLWPVVQFESSDVYSMPLFSSDAQPGSARSSDTAWPLIFAVCEKRFLRAMGKKLPEGACHLVCLQIVSFLHHKQCQLTGRSGLSQYHLKTALLHLLSRRPPADWHPDRLRHRLRDLLRFLDKALLEKRLNHFVIGNGAALPELDVPAAFRAAEPFNLFRGMVTHRALHRRARGSWAEMLKNAAVLIREYSLGGPGHDSGIRARHKAAVAEPS